MWNAATGARGPAEVMLEGRGMFGKFVTRKSATVPGVPFPF